MARRPWSRLEVEATVRDYMEMLSLELRGETFNKKQRNERLRELLDNRSHGAVEYKHENISAVLIELGMPYVNGYKPRFNVQALLREVVPGHISPELRQMIVADVDAEARVEVADPLALEVVVAPLRRMPKEVRDRAWTPPDRVVPVDYLRREEGNRRLGDAGEALVMAYEQARLQHVGLDHLARNVEQVSKTQGDRAGYDIRSYEEDGRDRFVEVKTTRYGKFTPFYISDSEVRFSETNWDKYQLYRLFEFREQPKLFVLPGNISTNVNLEAINFRAGF
ncbi:MAG: DUF3883 domain-containing protein [Gammaproteobacteria bacterium]|nr:DUF3883 domain-containing protein [Gammaproteobacteria bacterium]